MYYTGVKCISGKSLMRVTANFEYPQIKRQNTSSFKTKSRVEKKKRMFFPTPSNFHIYKVLLLTSLTLNACF